MGIYPLERPTPLHKRLPKTSFITTSFLTTLVFNNFQPLDCNPKFDVDRKTLRLQYVRSKTHQNFQGCNNRVEPYLNLTTQNLHNARIHLRKSFKTFKNYSGRFLYLCLILLSSQQRIRHAKIIILHVLKNCGKLSI